MNQTKPFLTVLFLLIFGTMLTAQEDVPGRIPKYPIPYELPAVDGIKEGLNRVRGYYESTNPQMIVDTETGEEITDFSKFNKNARVSSGFSSEWSYTHGVVLSAVYQIKRLS